MQTIDPSHTPEIVLVLEPEEAAAVAWIISRFLRRVPRPLTPLQRRLGGLIHYVQDSLPETVRLPDEPAVPTARSA